MARDREMQFDRHMSDHEALMWNVEKDPAMSSGIASLTILDTVPSFDRLRLRLQHAVNEIPRLRQRVVPSVGRLSPPTWADDPDFDLDYHVRRMAVPAPGGDRELYDLATLLLVDPFERTRPLWQFVVIEGLADGRGALVQKLHHTITDGEGGVRLAEKFVDLERDAADPEVAELPPAEPIDADFVESTREVIGHNARRWGGVAERMARSVVTNPTGTAAGVGMVVGEVAKTLMPSGDDGEIVGSPLWKNRGLKRWYGTIQVDLDDARRTAKGMGGSINDFFVAGALAGAAAYHADRDIRPDKFRVAMPVSTRKGGSAGGNNFQMTNTEMRASVDPSEAFEVVHGALSDAKERSSVDLIGSLSMVVNLLPTSVLASAAKSVASGVDFAVSNVRGAPFSLYMAGGKVLAGFPMSGTGGTAFNLTTMSYDGHLDMGILIDSGAVADPQDLRDAIAEAYDALIAAG